MSDLPEGFDPTTFANVGVEQNAGIPSNPQQTSVMLDTAAPTAEQAEQKDKKEETPEIAQRPEEGYDKFYDAKTGDYDWKAHAIETEFKLKMAKGKTAKKVVEPASDETDVSEAQAAVEQAGLDWDDLTYKVTEFGTVDEDDYEALEKAGIPRSIVDAHIQGLQAYKDVTKQQLEAKTGGPEGTQALMDWAAKNLPAKEVDAYNKMLSSQQWPVAIDALISRSGFRLPNAKPNLLRSGGGAGTETDIYSGERDLQADIGNPLYQKDPDFRAKVVAKLQRTHLAEQQQQAQRSSIGAFAGFNIGI